MSESIFPVRDKEVPPTRDGSMHSPERSSVTLVQINGYKCI